MNHHVPGELMIAEIHEQPTALARLIEKELKRVWQMAEPWANKPPRFIFIAARGTSDHVALYAKYLIETMNHIPVGLAAPSVSGIYNAHLNVEDALFIGISQSGEAADVISVLEQARRDGAATLAITNNNTSPITRIADHTIPLHAKPELAVAATKTFSSSMAALLMLSAAIGRSEKMCAELERLPSLVAEVIGKENQIDPKVERFRYLRECVVLGRGYNLATAYELSLKMRETSNIRAQPFASPDFVHGPIAIIEEGYPVIAFANRGLALPSVLKVITETQARGAEAVVIGNAPDALAIADVSFPILPERDIPEWLSPFPSIVAGQLFAHALAVLKGFDPDKPRGLQKVTITR